MSTFNLDWQVDTSQIDKLVTQLQATKDKAEAAATALDGVEVGVKKTTAATHEFSLANAGVVRELSVMFGEAMRGNWSRLEGSMTVLANRTGLMAMAFTPMGALIGAAAGAIGLLAVAAKQGADEQNRLTVALAMSGNAAGTTAGALIDLSRAAGQTAGNLSGAKEAVGKLEESGRFAGAQMLQLGTSAAEMSRVTGESVDKVVAKFVKLADEPVKASLELNKQYHYLTAAVFEQIAALERQGRAEEAAALAAGTYAEAMKKRSDEVIANLGYMQRAANATGQFFTHMWESIQGIGRKETLGEQLKSAQEQVDALQKKVDGGHGTDQTQKRLAAAKENLAVIAAAMHDSQMAAARDGDKQATEDGKVRATAWWEAHRKETLTQAQIEAEEVKKIRDMGAQAGKSGSEIEQAVSAYKSKHKHHTDNSGNNEAIEALRGQIAQEKVAYDLYLTQQEAALAKGDITQEEFNRRKAQRYQQELETDMQYAQQAKAIAESKGANFKSQVQYWQNEYDKYLAQKQLAQAQEEKADAQHAALIKALQDTTLRQADDFNAKRLNALEKANRQLYMTSEERAQADARDAIELEYQKLIDAEVQKLQQLHASTDDVAKAIADLNAKRQQALNTEADEVQKRLALQGDWTKGAQLAFKTYQENAANVAKQTEQLFTNAFNNMENALVNFATTGKFNFSDLAKSILSDIIRMEAKAAESKVLSYLGSSFGFGGTASAGGSVMDAGSTSLSMVAARGMAFGNGVPGMFAAGEVVGGPRFFAGGAGLMGEAGPEAIMPLTRDSAGRLGVQTTGSQAASVIAPVINVTVQGGKDAKETGDTVASAVAQKLMASIADARIANATRVGGILNR